MNGMANVENNTNITIKDIARLQGCSANTVSLALRDSPRISKEVRRKIHKLADELGYVPSFAAQSLRGSKSRSIGIRVLDIYNTVRIDYVNRLLPRIRMEMDYRPIFGTGLSRYGPENLDDCVWMRMFQEMAAEAVVLVGTGVYKQPVQSQIPLVYVGCQPDEEARCDYVGLDRQEVAKLAIDHLLGRGHATTLLIDPQSTVTQYAREYIRDSSMQETTLDIASDNTEEVVDSWLGLSASVRPTALFVSDTLKAVSLIEAFSAKGVKVPDDLAVVAYDYLSLNDSLRIPITTIEQPMAEMVDGIMDILNTRVSKPSHPHIKQVMHHKLVVRSSS